MKRELRFPILKPDSAARRVLVAVEQVSAPQVESADEPSQELGFPGFSEEMVTIRKDGPGSEDGDASSG